MARSYNTLGKEWEMRLKRLRINVEDPEYWDKIWVHPAANGRCVYVCVGVYMCNCHYKRFLTEVKIEQNSWF